MAATNDGKIEVRGVIAKNGNGELCFFADSRGEGLPLIGADGTWLGSVVARLYLAIANAVPRRISYDEFAALDAPPPEPSHDCEAELKARPDYSVGYGTPAVFECSCGKRYAYECEESEGAAWELIA